MHWKEELGDCRRGGKKQQKFGLQQFFYRKMRSEEPGDSGSGRRSPLEARRPAGPHSSLQEMRAMYRSTNRPGRGGSREGG